MNTVSHVTLFVVSETVVDIGLLSFLNYVAEKARHRKLGNNWKRSPRLFQCNGLLIFYCFNSCCQLSSIRSKRVKKFCIIIAAYTFDARCKEIMRGQTLTQ